MNGELLRARFPSIPYMRDEARRRIPHFAWEYLDSGTGLETALDRNREALDAVLLEPRFMEGFRKPALSRKLADKTWDAPLGVAPIGLSGMMWPRSECHLARAATRRNLPYCLSMMSCETPETVGPLTEGKGWFQLYPFKDKAAERDLLDRVRASGFDTLVVTVDVPINSTRERQRKAGVNGSERMTPARVLQIISHPKWAVETARRGKPSLRVIEKYVKDSSIAKVLDFISEQEMGAVDRDHMAALRDRWEGMMLVKGILDPQSARECADMGIDGVVVSNHGGRQLDAVPASISVLPAIAEEVGNRASILFDSGVVSGLDIARALALGADLVLCGRAFMYGVCVGAEEGAGAVADMLVDDLANNMMQLGVDRISDLPARIIR